MDHAKFEVRSLSVIIQKHRPLNESLFFLFKLDIYNIYIYIYFFFFGSIICVTIFGVFSCELLLVGFVVSHDEWKRLQEFGIWSPEDKDKPISTRPSWRSYPEFFFFFLFINLPFSLIFLLTPVTIFFYCIYSFGDWQEDTTG